MADDGIGDALRLGWHFAELRGRWRLVKEASPKPFIDLTPHASGEKSPAETAIQVEAVVREAAVTLKVDPPRRVLSYQPPKSAGTATARLHFLCVRIARASSDAAREAAWDRLTEFMWVWNLRIADTLTANSVDQATAYEFARSVAEIVWSNSTYYDAPDDLATRLPTLTRARGASFTRYLERLIQHFDALTTAALKQSLKAWVDIVAHDPPPASDDAMKALVAQADIWHDLVLGERTADQLIASAPENIKSHRFSVWPVLEQFWPQLAFSGGGFVVLSVAAYATTLPATNKLVSVGAGAIGLAGFTTAGLAARLKNSANDLLSNLRLALRAELVAEVATLLPKIG